MIKYEIIIYWSEEDGAFVAEVPELPGCAAHGDTQETALDNAQDAFGFGSTRLGNMEIRSLNRRDAA